MKQAARTAGGLFSSLITDRRSGRLKCASISSRVRCVGATTVPTSLGRMTAGSVRNAALEEKIVQMAVSTVLNASMSKTSRLRIPARKVPASRAGRLCKRQQQPESSSSSCSRMCFLTVSSCLLRELSTTSGPEKTTSTSSRETSGLTPPIMLRWARRRTLSLR